MTTTSSATPILSVQLYTLRTLGDVDGILSAVAAAGYRHVELVGSHLENAKPVAEKLAQYRLKPSSAHVSMAALRADPEKVLNACSVLGLADIFMPSVPADERQSPAEYWRALGAELAGVLILSPRAACGLDTTTMTGSWRRKATARRHSTIFSRVQAQALSPGKPISPGLSGEEPTLKLFCRGTARE